MKKIQKGSRWFTRLQKDLYKLSPYVRFQRIRHGFYRVYLKDAYVGEVYKDMPCIGYDKTDLDMHVMESKQYALEKIEDGEVQRLVKNFVEGYVDSLDSLTTRIHKFKHDKETYKTMTDGYKQMKVR